MKSQVLTNGSGQKSMPLRPILKVSSRLKNSSNIWSNSTEGWLLVMVFTRLRLTLKTYRYRSSKSKIMRNWIHIILLVRKTMENLQRLPVSLKTRSFPSLTKKIVPTTTSISCLRMQTGMLRAIIHSCGHLELKIMARKTSR